MEDRRSALEALTPRQREILRLIAQGHQAKEVARLLGISERTVKTHTDAARRRLGVATSREAARLLMAWEAEREAAPENPPPAEGKDLTPRQREILRLLTQHQQRKDIARTLDIGAGKAGSPVEAEQEPAADDDTDDGIVPEGHRPPGTMDETRPAPASSDGGLLSGGRAGATPPRGDLQAWLIGLNPMQWLALTVAVALVSALVVTGFVAAAVSAMEAFQRFYRESM